MEDAAQKKISSRTKNIVIMPTAITNDLLAPYFYKGKRHNGYDQTIALAKWLKVFANGEYPLELIDERRPSESDYIKDYRAKIFSPVTKEVPDKIIASLSKIRRSSDWSIRYETEPPSSIAKGETLKDYCESDFPVTKSVTNWVFSVLLKNYLLDPNSLILMRPLETEIEANQYLRPYPFIFGSADVIDYVPGDYAILRKRDEKERRKKTAPKGEINQMAKSYIVVNAEKISTYILADDNKYRLQSEYKHGLGYMPIVPMIAIFFDAFDTRPIYESRVHAIVPRIKEATREFSDLQAEVVQHIHSEKWEWASQKCGKCRDKMTGLSTGFIMQGDKKITCPKCEGHGSVPTSPYKSMVIRPTKENLGEAAPPIPPKGYIEKNVEIVKIQDERIDKHMYRALATINMQFLMQTPLNISGEAKELDKDELNNFVHSVAEDLVYIMDGIYLVINDYRYKEIIADKEKRREMLPAISVPEHFDLLSSNYLMEEVQKAKSAKINPVIVNGLEMELANKKFHSSPNIQQELQAALELDPLPATSEEEKMMRFQGGAVTKKDYVISSNLIEFIRNAVEENQKFYQLKRKERKEIIGKMADEKMKEMTGIKVELDDELDDE